MSNWVEVENNLKSRHLYQIKKLGKKEFPKIKTVSNKESIAIKIPKHFGEKTIQLLNKLETTNRKLIIQKDEDHIYIPLVRKLTLNEIEKIELNLGKVEVTRRMFPIKKAKLSLVKILEKTISSKKLRILPRAIEFVGDIAIIDIPIQLNQYRKDIGKAIIEKYVNVSTVLEKTGAITGPYRLRKLGFIYGENKTTTIHKEFGCRFYVDLIRAYFSPRLAHEHNRIANQVKEDETVIDMFAGVGPFSILIAKKQEKSRIFAIDLNPHAFKLLNKNILLNKTQDRVFSFEGDAKRIIKNCLTAKADRVIMNLPENSREFIEDGCAAIKPGGGIINYYCFVNQFNSLKNQKEYLKKAIEKTGRKIIENPFTRLVRATAPFEWQTVLDVKII